VLEAVNGLPGWLVWPVRGVMVFGTTGGALAVVALVGMGTLWRARDGTGWVAHRRPGWTPTIVSLLTAVVGARVAFEVLKRIVDRKRPSGFLTELPHLHVRDHAAGLGYPSGHATMSMAVALTLSACWPRARWPVVALAVAVSLGRLYVGVHLPLDVAGGMALGVLVSAVAAAVGRRLTAGASQAETAAHDVPH